MLALRHASHLYSTTQTSRGKSAHSLSRKRRPQVFELLVITFVLISNRHSGAIVNALTQRAFRIAACWEHTRSSRNRSARKDSTTCFTFRLIQPGDFRLRSGPMKFDELDAKMRVFETAHDRSVLPEMFLVARIDGRNFTRLTKEVHKFEAPYDVRFRDMMIDTTAHLMNCGFKTIYGYTQSDEISLLFDPAITTFDRKTRKFNSILAGEASAKFSLLLNNLACFDCR